MFLTFEELILKSKKTICYKNRAKNRLKIFSKNVLILKIYSILNSFEELILKSKKNRLKIFSKNVFNI
jgi:hypothetical protein